MVYHLPQQERYMRANTLLVTISVALFTEVRRNASSKWAGG